MGVAVERKEPKGLGRCRIAVLADASAKSLRAFLVDHVEDGSTVVTDGWTGYLLAAASPYVHERLVVPSRDAPQLLPGVHRVASLAKRWLLGTHQGAVGAVHLPSYLDVLRLSVQPQNVSRRGLVFYRLIELAVAHDPGVLRYHELVAAPKSRKPPPTPPGAWGHPPSLQRPPADRPWRAADLASSG